MALKQSQEKLVAGMKRSYDSDSDDIDDDDESDGDESDEDESDEDDIDDESDDDDEADDSDADLLPVMKKQPVPEGKSTQFDTCLHTVKCRHLGLDRYRYRVSADTCQYPWVLVSADTYFSIGADTSSSFTFFNSQHCCMHACSFKPIVYLIHF